MARVAAHSARALSGSSSGYNDGQRPSARAEDRTMPIHDWTRVEAGIFHDFHHEWISTIKRAVNQGLSGTNYYALAEQIAGGLGPDVLTLQRPLTKGVPAAKSAKARPKSGRAGGTLT